MDDERAISKIESIIDIYWPETRSPKETRIYGRQKSWSRYIAGEVQRRLIDKIDSRYNGVSDYDDLSTIDIIDELIEELTNGYILLNENSVSLIACDIMINALRRIRKEFEKWE